MLKKLEQDEKILKIIKVPGIKMVVDANDPYYEDEDGCYHIELLPAFDEYFLKIQEEEDYQKFTGKKLHKQPKQQLTRKSLEKIWNILQEIENKRGITSIGDDISIPQVGYTKVPTGNADKIG